MRPTSLPHFPAPVALGTHAACAFLAERTADEALGRAERGEHGMPARRTQGPHRARWRQSLALAPVGALLGSAYGRWPASMGIDLGLQAWEGRVLEALDWELRQDDAGSAQTCTLLYGAAGLLGAALLPWLTAQERTAALRAGWLGAQGPPTLGLCAAFGAGLTTAVAFAVTPVPTESALQLASTVGAALGASAGAYAVRRLTAAAVTR